MYAIIRAGGKQAKVQSGDVIEIERVKGDPEELSFAPLLIVDDKGNAVSDRDALAKASVTAKVLGESQGPKIDIFKYRNKTGYRRRQGHRQVYTQIEIIEIKLPGAKAKTASDKSTSGKTDADKTDAAKSTDEKPATTKTTAAKSDTAQTTAQTTAAKSGAAKTAAKPKTDAAKSSTAKTTTKPKTDPAKEK